MAVVLQQQRGPSEKEQQSHSRHAEVQVTRKQPAGRVL